MSRPGWQSPQGCARAGSYLHGEQDVQPFKEDRVNVEEVAGQQAVDLGAEERPPAGVRVGWGWSEPTGAKDPPHGRFDDLVSQGRVLLIPPQPQPAPLTHTLLL